MRIKINQVNFIKKILFGACLLFSMFLKAQQKIPIRVLIVGGNSSHDFAKWYGQTDVTTLEEDGLAKVIYTENTDSIEWLLPAADVLFLANNKPVKELSARKAIFDFVASGHGLLLGHAATWYNWRDWPEYNEKLVGGGANGHGSYESFKVQVAKKHPVTKGLDQTFTAQPDELYYFFPDNLGENITVLTKSYLPKQPGKFFPSVFIVKHSSSRIVAITFGHDGAAHESKPYKTILRNALKWVANK